MSQCFDGQKSVEEKTDCWLKVLQKKFYKCFKKIRITKTNKTNEIQQKLTIRMDLKKIIKNSNDDIEQIVAKKKLNDIENEISEKTSFDNFEKIKKHIGTISNLEGGMSHVGMWKFKKELVAYVTPSNLPVVGEQGWIFVIKHDIGDFGIMSGMLTLRDNMIIYSAIIVTIALGMGLVFARSISVPITKLTYLAKEIGKENFDVKVNLKG